MDIAAGTKFACIAMIVRDVALPPEGVALDEGLVVLPRVPFLVENFWTEWTGKTGTKPLAEGNCVILASVPSATPTLLDAEFESLRKRASGLLQAMHLEGSIALHEGLIALGGRDGDELSVRQVAQLETHVRPAYVLDTTIDEQLCRDAWSTFRGMAHLYEVRGHDRVKRGYHAVRGAFAERSGAERLHQFVRGIEAFVKPEQGRGRRQFGSRGTVLAGPASEELMKELFDLRSQAEHLNDLVVTLKHADIIEPERLALYRSYQAQVLASWTYRQFFRSPELILHCQDDKAIEAFWALPEAEQRRLWGAHIDVEAVARRKFYPLTKS